MLQAGRGMDTTPQDKTKYHPVWISALIPHEAHHGPRVSSFVK